MHLQAIKYERGKLEILNQLLLPTHWEYESITSVQEAFDVIQQMKVRGAPIIALTALLSIAIEIQHVDNLIHEGRLRRLSKLDFFHYLEHSCNHLCTARPTAVNIRRESDAFLAVFDKWLHDKEITLEESVVLVEQYLSSLLAKDVECNKAIGQHGCDHILRLNPGIQRVNVLTICNTGSLATAGYGTALGVVRSLFGHDRLNRCYFVETRPYNQGSRLTASELLHDCIPATLICDSMISPLMRKEQIHAVVVGVDRMAANGDFANKIGTQQMGLIAHHYKVPFFAACPLSSVDLKTSSGKDIPVELRQAKEMQFVGDVQIAPIGTLVWKRKV